MLLLTSFVSLAQDAVLPEPGTPPDLTLITRTSPDAERLITVSGEAASVFPNADMLVQNRFTGESIETQAGSDGSFSLEIYAPGNPPLWIQAGETATIFAPPVESGRFHTGGLLSGGGADWVADGSIKSAQLQPGDALNLSLTVTMHLPDLSESVNDLRMGGELYLLPLNDANGNPSPIGVGWSSDLTQGSLPVESSAAPIFIGESQAISTFRRGDTLRFRLRFQQALPDDLAQGVYVPLLSGFAQIGDSDPFTWEDNLVFSVEGDPAFEPRQTILPITLTVGDIEIPRQVWSLFHNEVADGSNGVLAQDEPAALSNRVRFNSPDLMLPPGEYPIEPYLPAFPPELLPLTGELEAAVTRPNGDRSRLLPAEILQTQFDAGTSAPRLTTLDPRYGAFPFDAYGDYQIEISGTLQDAQGHTADGGGVYSLTIAEPLDITPAVLSGAPFVMGDHFNPGLSISPPVPADVTVMLRLFPLDAAAPQEYVIEGAANPWGVFQSDAIPLDFAGEYSVDYAARYTDETGRLWGASLRAAGVIASPESELVASGQRGVADYDRQTQAWFNTTVYPSDEPRASTRPYFPFYSGDIAWTPDTESGGIHPAISANQPYDRAYISAVRPDAPLLQWIQRESIDAPWNSLTDFAGQIGMGEAGNQAGDFAFLFGGVVSDEAVAGYASLAITVAEDQPARVEPPFGVASARQPLLTFQDEPIDLFFHPTGIQPGQIIEQGSPFTLTGYAAPPLPADVDATLIAPSGERISIGGRANAFGYFHLIDDAPILDEVGVWRVNLNVTYSGMTSAGMVEEPYPQGSTLGEFLLYVVPSDSEPLAVAVDPTLSPLDFTLAIPADWTDITAYHTIRTPGFVLNSGELSSNRYVYDANGLQNTFPMLDDGDVIEMTFAVTGRDAAGQPAIQVRSYTLRAGQLLEISTP